jgi:hypothetical protein
MGGKIFSEKEGIVGSYKQQRRRFRFVALAVLFVSGLLWKRKYCSTTAFMSEKSKI